MDFAIPSLAILSSVTQPSTVLAQAEGVVGSGLVLTIACAIAAIALVLLMRPGPTGVRIAGTVGGLAGFAILVVEVLKRAGGEEASLGTIFPLIFSFVALAGAVRMVTHPRPVFAALYFILVVIATAAMFLVLGAEFMAFALIIVYAGAILITYMFVLMLAQQSPVENEGGAWYDRVPREAGSAVLIGFVVLATMSEAFFSKSSQSFRDDVAERTAVDGMESAWARLDSMPKLLLETSQNAVALDWAKNRPEGDKSPAPTVTEVIRDSRGSAIRMTDDQASIEVRLADGTSRSVTLPPELVPDNSRQIGVDLVSKYPAGLEIAGVVLLMALFGAVVLARKQIELGEDERRELAGMRRLTVDGESGGSGGLR
ncbi:MAG: putative NADH-quinone oxidoreductase subunit [Planctomycetota bacterium]|jgi:NADH-quinone oxidoreductase subunit J